MVNVSPRDNELEKAEVHSLWDVTAFIIVVCFKFLVLNSDTFLKIPNVFQPVQMKSSIAYPYS